jgi:SAM-dependent methyltransferase
LSADGEADGGAPAKSDAAGHWLRQYAARIEAAEAGRPVPIRRWWQAEPILRHINRRVCGEELPGMHAGFHALVRRRFGPRLPFARTVSVGGGTGEKEMLAAALGLFESVDLYDLAASAVELGRKLARERGLGERLTFHLGHPFDTPQPERYDAVYWNNALHHMPDVEAALAWSRAVLRPGGALLMDDYVGADRFQWSNRMLAANRAFWASLPAHYRRDPESGAPLRPPARTDLAALIASDPSEAADSARILPALRRIFPGAEILATGGGVYHWALNDVMHWIIAAGDAETLQRALALDDWLAARGETQYAVALATKVED